MTKTKRLTALVLSLALALPGAALAQSAGDDQYVDPFEQSPEGSGGNSGGGGGGGGGSQGNQGSNSQGSQGGGSQGTQSGSGTAGAGSDSGTAGAAAQGAVGTSGSEAGSGSGNLPRTGFPAAVLALIGAVLLAGGATLRRRA